MWNVHVMDMMEMIKERACMVEAMQARFDHDAGRLFCFRQPT